MLVSVQMSSCLPKQLLPGNWITGKENSCYPNSSLPGNLWYNFVSNKFFKNVSKFFLNPKKVFFTLNNFVKSHKKFVVICHALGRVLQYVV